VDLLSQFAHAVAGFKIIFDEVVMRVFSFGASTAQGMRDDDGGGFIARLGKRLNEADSGTAENFGIGGETTDQMSERAGTLNCGDGDVAVVTLGINDIARTPDRAPHKRVSLARHRANVAAIVGALVGKGCKVVYLTQYPVDCVAHGLDPAQVSAYVRVGHEAAEEVGVAVIDVNSAIDDALYRRFIFADGMHFNGDGHAFIADLVWEWLQSER
jgi:lysophospholipase L1-like esterase